jgi:hypothetical protein
MLAQIGSLQQADSPERVERNSRDLYVDRFEDWSNTWLQGSRTRDAEDLLL